MAIQGILGLFVFIGVAWGLSENKRLFPWKMAITGVFLQILIAFVLLKFPAFKEIFVLLNQLVTALEQSTRAGTSFVFGYLGGGDLPFQEKFPGSSFVFAFQALPLVLVISALSSLLFYWKVMPFIVRIFSWFFQKTLGIGGAEALSVSANIFLGQVESPLIIRPYLRVLTRSELFSVMTCGMATIAGTVMVLYASILSKAIPDIMGHILVASIISVPASILISKIMVPETGELTKGDIALPGNATSSFDAITQGTVDGVNLLINIIAMLIVLVALVFLANVLLGIFPKIGGEALTLQRILGVFMAPVVWLLGIPWNETSAAAALMGTKTVLNEFIAYLDMSLLPSGVLSQRSLLIMTYAMCGFANPGSLGIMIGGMGTMVPERRKEIVELGFRTIISGTLATLMSGAVIGLCNPV